MYVFIVSGLLLVGCMGKGWTSVVSHSPKLRLSGAEGKVVRVTSNLGRRGRRLTKTYNYSQPFGGERYRIIEGSDDLFCRSTHSPPSPLLPFSMLRPRDLFLQSSTPQLAIPCID
jgi:hypothetical protein